MYMIYLEVMGEKQKDTLAGIIHCPVCGRELGRPEQMEGGYECRCGEFVPKGLALNSKEGCTHGRQCNCSRSMRR